MAVEPMTTADTLDALRAADQAAADALTAYEDATALRLVALRAVVAEYGAAVAARAIGVSRTRVYQLLKGREA